LIPRRVAAVKTLEIKTSSILRYEGIEHRCAGFLDPQIIAKKQQKARRLSALEFGEKSPEIVFHGVWL